MNWDQLVDRITPLVVRIDTPTMSGTGFLCLYNDDRSWVGIATAGHVIFHADQWVEPIRITTPTATQLFQPSQRIVLPNWDADSAVLMIPNDFNFTQNVIPFFPTTSTLPIGWIGFPSNITSGSLCFFTGTVSAIEQYAIRSYLIDGVAIHGVSGAPVVYHDRTGNDTNIVGILTAYRANRQYGESLPGLSVAQDVSHFHAVGKTIKDHDDAQRKKREFEQLLQSLQNRPPPQ